MCGVMERERACMCVWMHVFVHKCENENLYVGLTLCCVCDREQRESVMCVYGCMKECVYVCLHV